MDERQALTTWESPQRDGYIPPGVLLSRRFYAWEIRGRGWHLWPKTVKLEPPFVEFWHRLPSAAPEARRPAGLLSSLTSLFGSNVPAVRRIEQAPEQEFATAPTLAEVPDLVELRVAVPKSVSASRDMVEQFLLVSTEAGALGFEIVGTQGETVLQMVSTKRQSKHVREQLKGHFPGVVVTESPQHLISTWCGSDGPSLVVDFGLSNEFMRPLKTAGGFNPDPLIAVVSALEGLGPGEVGVFQVLCERAVNPWNESILRAVQREGKLSFIEKLPELPSMAREKVRGTMFAAVIRVAARAEDATRCKRIIQGLAASMRPVAQPGSNELMPLTNEGFPEDVHAEDLLLRISHRCGMLLSSSELMTLVHLPTPAVACRSLVRVGKRTAPAPKIARPTDCVLGINSHEGVDTPVGLTSEQRLQHCYMIGGSGTGKSTLLRNLIVQDILAGRGVAVLDPHGDLVDDILRYIPWERAEDVVLFDPADTEYPVGFNFLQAHTELEKNLLASDLVSVFRRFSTSWGDQMNTVLGNAIMALLDVPGGRTIADLRRFLLEKEFRREILREVRDPEVRYWWEKQFPLLKGTPYASVLTRLDTFLRPKPLRYVVAQREASLNLGEVMSEGKIFLGKLAQGLIGEENAHLLGSLMVSKFHQLAMARQAEAKEGRRDFQLYVDEFHHFVSPSMAAILCGARKYRLGLTLAHQELRQLAERDRELLASLLSNAYTRIMFRVGDEDARKLADGLSSFEAKDLQNQGRGEAIVRVERAEFDFNLTTDAAPEWLEEQDEDTIEAIVAYSQAQYGRSVTEIEEELAEAYDPVETAPPASAVPPVTSPASPAAPPPEDVRASEAIEEPPPKRAPRMAGKGSSEHRTLQHLVKAYGEARGLRATIEKQIDGSHESIDVLLEAGSLRIACEIAITTDAAHELGNIRKDIEADASHVLSVCEEPATRSAITAGLSPDEAPRVRCVPLAELEHTLDQLTSGVRLATPGSRGWTVETKVVDIEEPVASAKQRGVFAVLRRAMSRIRGGRS